MLNRDIDRVEELSKLIDKTRSADKLEKYHEERDALLYGKDDTPSLQERIDERAKYEGDDPNKAATVDEMTEQNVKAGEPVRTFDEHGNPLHPLEASKNSEEPGSKNATAEQKAQVHDYIEKTLGPDVATQFVKTLLNPKTGAKESGSAQWFRKNGKAVVQIVLNAANPLGKAHHEAMHEFFQRLMDDKSEAADTLRQAANSAPVLAQMRKFFKDNPEIIKALKDDQHERVAYMFQLWAADKLNVGPKTETVFGRVVSFLRKAMGMVSNSEHAEAIMQAFHNGEMADSDAVAAMLHKSTPSVDAWLDQTSKTFHDLANLVTTSQNLLLDSGNPVLERIGRMFSYETGHKTAEQSFMDAKVQKSNQMLTRVAEIIHSFTPDELNQVLEGKQNGTISDVPRIALAQKRISHMLEQVYDYATQAGVKVNHAKDYFPRAWDSVMIGEHKDELVKQLVADYEKKHGEKPAAGMVSEAVDKIIANRGADPLSESEWALGMTPFMKAANSRKIDWINDKDYGKYMQKDLVNILSTNISHAVHRAEYVRRFGEHGEILRGLLEDAMQHELSKRMGKDVGTDWKAATKAAKAAAEGKDTPFAMEDIINQLPPDIRAHVEDASKGMQAARRAIMAMEGTLGADVSNGWRNFTTGAVVYENMRLLGLSLFSQFTDPLGVVIRGGTLGDALNTYKEGLKATVKGWEGKELEGHYADLAKKLGIIDPTNTLNTMGNMQASVFMGKKAKWLNDKLFRWNGVEMFSQGTRVGATKAAIEFIKHQLDSPHEHSARWLEELYGEKHGEIKRDADGELDFTDKANQTAIFRWVDGAMLRPNAAMRPPWASDPHFALFFHMKQFTYAFHKVMLERVANEMRHGNYDPAMCAILGYVPVAIAASIMRGAVSNGGQQPAWKKNWTVGDYLQDGAQRAGLLGIPQIGLDAAKWGPAELGGPVVEQVVHGGKAIEQTHARDTRLDEIAASTGRQEDIDKAEAYSGAKEGGKRVLRDAVPKTPMWKKAEQAVLN